MIHRILKQPSWMDVKRYIFIVDTCEYEKIKHKIILKNPRNMAQILLRHLLYERKLFADGASLALRIISASRKTEFLRWTIYPCRGKHRIESPLVEHSKSEPLKQTSQQEQPPQEPRLFALKKEFWLLAILQKNNLFKYIQNEFVYTSNVDDVRFLSRSVCRGHDSHGWEVGNWPDCSGAHPRCTNHSTANVRQTY